MERLHELKPFCLQHSDDCLKDVMLTDLEWTLLENCISILKPFKKYSTQLQSESSTLSDFFGYWLLLKISLERRTDILSINLLKHMNNRHDTLMNNPVLVACVYLDPRFQRAIQSQKQLAIEMLKSIYSRMEAIDIVEGEESTNDDRNKSSNSIEGDLQQYLDACSTVHDTSDIDSKIRSFDNVAPEQVKSSVLEYWGNRQKDLPELYKLASVVLAIPPTQCTVERAFSALAIVLSSRRAKLGDFVLADILLVRFNFDLLNL